MYQEHFKLERAPFSLLPDPEFLYLSEQHSSAKAFLESSAFVHDSFVVITGEIGAGKTTLVEGFLADLKPEDTIIARINQTQLSPTGLLRLLLDELGIKAFRGKKPQLLSRFNKFMARTAAGGRTLVIVIDEAQNLSRNVLEEIRMLTGSKHAKSLSVVLIGQPEFLTTLESPQLKQLAQRCRLRSNLKALPKDDSIAYIGHRIAIAGGDPDTLFTKAAKKRAFEATGGVPRLLNSLCDTALICAFADGLMQVDVSEIEAALIELKWQPQADTTAPDEQKRPDCNNEMQSLTDHSEDTEHRRQLEAQQDRIAQLEEQLVSTTPENSQFAPSTLTSEVEVLRRSHTRLDELQQSIEQLTSQSDEPAPPQDAPDSDDLIDQSASLLDGLDELQTQLEKLEAGSKSAETSETKVAELESQLKNVEKSDAQKRQLIEELHAEADANERELRRLSKLEENAVSQSEAFSELEKRAEQLAANLKDSEDAHNTLLESLDSEDNLHAKLARTVSEFDDKIAARDDSICSLEKEVRRKNTLIDQLHDKLAPLPEIESRAEYVYNENAALKKDLETKSERIFEMQEALSLSQQRLDEARREQDLAQNDAVGRHMEIGELKAKAAGLVEESRLRDELAQSLQTECQNRKTDLRNMRKKLDETLDQSRELRDSQELGENRVRELESELEAALETIREMGESNAQVSTNANEFEHEVAAQEQDLSVLRKELKTSTATIQSLEASLKQKTETIMVLEMDSDTSIEARPDATGDGSNYEVLVTQLRGEIEARDKRITEISASAEESKTALAELSEKFEERAALAMDLESKLESSRMAAIELREELGIADREFNETAVLGDAELEPDEITASHKTTEAGLLVTTQGCPTRRIALRNDRLIIGRTRDSDIKIDNEFASRHHAQIVFRNGRYVLEDLNSTNGIFVNKRRIKKRQLRNRDVISIGEDKMVFMLEQHTSH